MNRGSTLLLRLVVILLGAAVLGACIATFPALIKGQLDEYAPVLIGLYVSAIPFFFALHQTLRLLQYIDNNRAFSDASAAALKKVKYNALTISGLYVVGLPYIFLMADQDDAPGVFALGLVMVGASFVIATSAGVLQKLLENALAIKSENDLTV